MKGNLPINFPHRYSKDLEDLCLECLNKDPQNRPTIREIMRKEIIEQAHERYINKLCDVASSSAKSSSLRSSLGFSNRMSGETDESLNNRISDSKALEDSLHLSNNSETMFNPEQTLGSLGVKTIESHNAAGRGITKREYMMPVASGTMTTLADSQEVKRKAKKSVFNINIMVPDNFDMQRDVDISVNLTVSFSAKF